MEVSRLAEYEKDLYDILEVSPHASIEVINHAYKALTKKWHPDGHREEFRIQAEEKFKEINIAYEILSNKEKRSEYDQQQKGNQTNTNNGRNQSRQNIKSDKHSKNKKTAIL